jgi:hypothetical protein
MKTIILALFVGCLFGIDAAAAPSLSVAKVSGRAGGTVKLPIAFDPGSDPVASIQFSLLLPPSVSTISVSAGPVMTAVGKSVGAARKGDVWTFIVYGVRNQNKLEKGSLLTATVKIASGTAAGVLAVPVSRASYSSALGEAIVGGVNADGEVQVVR